MGFWYFLILLIGIIFIIVGALKKDVSRSIKIVIMLFIFGILFIMVSLFMFLPGSAEFISELLSIRSLS